MSKQQLTRQEAISTASIGISFNAFLSKDMLLQIMPNNGGVRIYFGEQNGQRSIVTVGAIGRFRRKPFIYLRPSPPSVLNVELEHATRMKSIPIDFSEITLTDMEGSNSIFSLTNLEDPVPDTFKLTRPFAWFHSNHIMDLLNVEGCVGLRIFPGMAGISDDGVFDKMALLFSNNDTEEDLADDPEILSFFPSLIVIGVDANGNDLGTTNTEFEENPYTMSMLPCPPACGQGSTMANPFA